MPNKAESKAKISINLLKLFLKNISHRQTPFKDDIQNWQWQMHSCLMPIF